MAGDRFHTIYGKKFLTKFFCQWIFPCDGRQSFRASRIHPADLIVAVISHGFYRHLFGTDGVEYRSGCYQKHTRQSQRYQSDDRLFPAPPKVHLCHGERRNAVVFLILPVCCRFITTGADRFDWGYPRRHADRRMNGQKYRQGAGCCGRSQIGQIAHPAPMCRENSKPDSPSNQKPQWDTAKR